MGLATKQPVPSFQNSSSSIITKEPQEVETILVEKSIRVNPLARVRVDEVKEFRLGQFRPVEANERLKRSTTRTEAEYKIALIFYDSTVKEAHFTISLGMGKIK
ncbi:unnamed protein product [Lupinus luteus]|uniref:Uncharacterized protein n=1 Tax=Lupinus luteus TaxID=3873 RepID=A0AAV1Y7N5_LUPLU